MCWAGVGFDIRCYIVYYILYLYIIIHYYYYILYYTLLLPFHLPYSSPFQSPSSSSSIPLLLSSQSITFLFPILYYTLPNIPFPSSSSHLLPFLLYSQSFPSSSSQYSFYTCRYLHILIYIIWYSRTPNTTRSIGVDGWGVMCLIVGNGILVYVLSVWRLLCFVLMDGLTLGVILYITIIYYTIIILLLYIIHIIYYTILFFPSFPINLLSSFPIFILYLSVLTYGYLYSIISSLIPFLPLTHLHLLLYNSILLFSSYIPFLL